MTLIDKAEVLLPCPFCGSPSPRYQMGFGVRCSACDASVPCFGDDFEPWNRRAIPARGVGVKPETVKNAVMGWVWAEDSDVSKRLGPKHTDALIARILAALEPVAAPNLKRIGTGIYETQPTPDHAAIREAWEKAYWRMRSYAVHDNDCKLNKPPHFNGPCSCGLTAALEEALALISKGATEPTEYGRKVAQMKKDFPNGI